jgi:hypothetical protein
MNGLPTSTAGIARTPGVRPLAPVFISYRTSDGRDLATTLAWALRTTGVPVWHDAADLPPGDTTRRLQEALTAGLSGAVLLVTPQIRRSTVVREIELPRLLTLEADPAFTFAVGSTVRRRPTRQQRATGQLPGLDFTAPDRLLAQPDDTLQRFKQYPLFDSDNVAALARELAAQRMAAVRTLRDPTLLLDIQTRLDPRGTPPEVPLAVRIPSPSLGRRTPNPAVWTALASFLDDLPRLLAIAQAQRLHVRGGGHLSIAFALGAAVPTTSSWSVTVEDQTGEIWGSASPDIPPEIISGPSIAHRAAPLGSPVAIHIDLALSDPPGDAFGVHLARHPDRYAAILRLVPVQRSRLLPTAGAAVVTGLAQRIRACAAEAGTHRVHLFLRTPFPVVVLLGRALNTLEITLYEWDDISDPPDYIQTATVASGRGGGPVISA